MRLDKAKKGRGKGMSDETLSIRIAPPTTKLEKEFAGVIVETLSRLPKKVRDKVINKVSFELCVDGMVSCIIAHPDPDEPTIMFNYPYLAKKSDSFKMKVVAHEIGHFVLNHLPKRVRINKKLDREVDGLCEEWGIGRLPRTG